MEIVMLNVLLYVKNRGKANHGACHYLKCHTGSQDIKWIRTKANNEITNFGQFSQSLNRIRLFVTPWTAGHQASLSITNSRNLLKLVFMESIVPSNHLILCHPLLLPPSIFASIRVFSNESRAPGNKLPPAKILGRNWSVQVYHAFPQLVDQWGGSALSDEPGIA